MFVRVSIIDIFLEPFTLSPQGTFLFITQKQGIEIPHKQNNLFSRAKLMDKKNFVTLSPQPLRVPHYFMLLNIEYSPETHPKGEWGGLTGCRLQRG